MLNSKKIEQFTRYIHESIPKIIHDLKCDLDFKIHEIIKKQINCMNFVNQDEFDLYSKRLFEIKEKLKNLETRVKNLELINKLKNNPNR